MKELKLNYLIEGMIYIVFGIFIIFIPESFFRIILGIILIISNLHDAIYGTENKAIDVSTIRAYFLIFLGFAILIWGIDVFVSIWGFLILLALAIDFFTSKNKIEHLKQNFIKYLFALILVSLGLSFLLNILLYLTSSILIIYGLTLVILTIIAFYSRGKQKSDNIIEGKVIDNDEEK